jgi:chitin disaccharide deacetylase
MRRLIVNADDFGLTEGVNRGIVESHQRGIVTSATLMACGSRFEEAVSLAKEVPRLSVGCHVVLVDGAPMLGAAEVSSLVGRNSASSTSSSSSKASSYSPSPLPLRFRDSLISFAIAATSGRLDEGEIEAEISAQVRKLQAAGIAVSHLDSHKHTHVFPCVLRGMLRAAKNCDVRAIRNPFEPLVFATMGGWKRSFQLRMMSSFRKKLRRALGEAGVVAPDGCVGVAATGGLSEHTFRELIEKLPEGTWEFVSHPGYNDAELDQVKTRLRESREKELAILTAAASKEILRREQVQLISYREL